LISAQAHQSEPIADGKEAASLEQGEVHQQPMQRKIAHLLSAFDAQHFITHALAKAFVAVWLLGAR
jgi:hypothetical protein